ncbi:MAG: hypothetical protein ACRDL7_14465, partial [Gaiellaceae bacterium]
TADGLGGWTISPHHFFDTQGAGALYKGDGSVVLGEEQYPVVTTVTSAVSPSDVAIAPDGTLYISSGLAGSIYRLAPGSTSPERIAGLGSPSSTGFRDGVPGPSCPLQDPAKMALAADGSLFFVQHLDGNSPANADSFPRVCELTPDGIIHAVTAVRAAPSVGGSPVGDGDGGLATGATIAKADGIAIGPDGSIFVADKTSSSYCRVRRIDASGVITTYAGGNLLPTGETPGRSTAVGFKDASALAVDADGTLYIGDAEEYCVKAVSRSGWTTTPIAGNQGDMVPFGLSCGPDGGLYVASNVSNIQNIPYRRIYRFDRDGAAAVVAGRYAPAEDSKEGWNATATSLSSVSG